MLADRRLPNEHCSKSDTRYIFATGRPTSAPMGLNVGTSARDVQQRKPRSLLITLLTVMLAIASVCLAEAPPLQVSLEQRFGRALFRSCVLQIQVIERAGRGALRCVRNTSPPTEFASERALTPQELERLRRLSSGSGLFSGTAIGKSFEAVDGVTETVSVQRGSERIVLVASGNPSFETGSRRELLNLLHSIVEDLRRASGN